MKNCWQILGIDATHDVAAIRKAYLALLPRFHPETDPQGFKQLRQAYEEALRLAEFPAVEEEAVTKSAGQEPDMLNAFRALLLSGTDRFLTSAWQQFIRTLNDCSVEEVDELRWPLCKIAMATPRISFACVTLLADRLSWRQGPCLDDIDEEELESFLTAVSHGDIFNFNSILHLSVPAQNEAIDFFTLFGRLWFYQSEWLMDFILLPRTVVTPDDERLQRNLLCWYSSLRYGMPELIAYARAWREAEPENEDALYFECAQRLFCGEGDSLLSDLCGLWRQYPSSQTDALLLAWCRRHKADYFPLVVMLIEARALVDDKGDGLLYISGESMKTRLLWAEMAQDERLSALSRSFIDVQLNKGIRAQPLLHDDSHPLWPLYAVADRLCRGEPTSEALLTRLVTCLDREPYCPLEELIIRMLLTQSAVFAAHCKTAPPQPAVSTGDDTAGGCLSAVKVMFYIALIGVFVVKLINLFA